MCLRQKRPESDIQSILTAMLDELAACSQCGGGLFISSTTFVHVKLRKVHELMWILDSEGVERRKAH